MILALVPRDLLHQLPVPKRIRTYLDTPFYYSETIADWTVPGNEPVSLNLSKDGGNEIMGPSSNEPEVCSPGEDISSPFPSNLERKESTSAIQTYHREGCSGGEVDTRTNETSLKTAYSQRTLQNTSGANKEPKLLNSANTDTNCIQSQNISVFPSPLSVQNEKPSPEQELSLDSGNAVLEPCDAPPHSDAHSSSPAPP